MGLSVCLSVCLSVYMSLCLSGGLSGGRSVCLSVCRPLCLSVFSHISSCEVKWGDYLERPHPRLSRRPPVLAFSLGCCLGGTRSRSGLGSSGVPMENAIPSECLGPARSVVGRDQGMLKWCHLDGNFSPRSFGPIHTILLCSITCRPCSFMSHAWNGIFCVFPSF